MRRLAIVLLLGVTPAAMGQVMATAPFAPPWSGRWAGGVSPWLSPYGLGYRGPVPITYYTVGNGYTQAPANGLPWLAAPASPNRLNGIEPTFPTESIAQGRRLQTRGYYARSYNEPRPLPGQPWPPVRPTAPAAARGATLPGGPRLRTTPLRASGIAAPSPAAAPSNSLSVPTTPTRPPAPAAPSQRTSPFGAPALTPTPGR